MKLFKTSLIIILGSLISFTLLPIGEKNFSQAQGVSLPVFPGAEGFGVYTPAGRGGQIIKVTNLNNSGPGSFIEAVQTLGPRIVVFEVSGYIDLERNLIITEPYLTIAGQTAPEPGITIRNFQVMIKTHDVLIQHIHFRPGDYTGGSEPGNRDAIVIGAGGEAYNVIIDHVSMTWAIDETATVWDPTLLLHDITISNSIIAEALDESLHSKAAHSKGLLISIGVHNLSIIKNLMMSNVDRNPKLNGDTTVFYANNIIYNTRWWFGDAYDPRDAGPIDLTVIGNIGLRGPNGPGGVKPIFLLQGDYGDGTGRELDPGTRVFADDNICTACDPDDPWTAIRNDNDFEVRVMTPPLWPNEYTLITSSETQNYIEENVGAYPWARDEVDQRLINDLKNNTGSIKDCVTPDPLYFPTGTAEGGTENTIILSSIYPNYSTYDDRYNSKYIEITGGTGSGQIRQVIDYVGATRIVTVGPGNWDTIPDNTSQYRIVTDCTKNAGGWPVLAENYVELNIPDNPNGDDDGDGYTNIEEWLFNFPPDEIPPALINDLEAN